MKIEVLEDTDVLVELEQNELTDFEGFEEALKQVESVTDKHLVINLFDETNKREIQILVTACSFIDGKYFINGIQDPERAQRLGYI